MMRKPYPSDVSDAEWAFVAPYLTLMREDAPQRDHALREVFNGLRWLVRTGAQWRMMPNDLPPWHTVYQQAQRWIAAGVFEDMVHDLAQSRTPWIGDRMIVSYSFVVGFANHSWTEIQHFLGMAAAQQKVLVGMGFLLAAVVLTLFLGIFRALATSFRAVDQEIWLRFGYHGAVSHGFSIAFRRQLNFG